MSISEELPEFLRRANELGASDIHLTAGSQARLRIGGRLVPFGEPLTPADTLSVAAHILNRAGRLLPNRQEEFVRSLREADCVYSVSGVGRYRANISKQRGSAMIVLRVIPSGIPTMEELGLPPVVADIAMAERGLVLVTGATGAGKSTTLACMIDHINARRPCKIITIEDPIEFLHPDNVAAVAQREIGSDTERFADAMRAALRQDPDVILVGELPDSETVDMALKAVETGHLVMSALHTPDALRTINRLISFCDPVEQQMMRMRLADSLLAIISQRLFRRKDGEGRVPVLEIMHTTASVRDAITTPENTGRIAEYVKAGRDQQGMLSFDQHLSALVAAGLIEADVAKSAATSPADGVDQSRG
jgi:twitching motility protein PilT